MSRPTYVLVDGENIDATLGMSVLGHRPAPEERPRWDRILEFAHRIWAQDVRGLFFLNASNGQMPMSFVQALLALDFHPIPLSGSKDESVVDIGIQRTLEALHDRPGDVLLVSHDGDFVPQVESLLGTDRRMGVVCFREFVSAKLSELTERGLRIYDLEDDVAAFNAPLPRVRIIPLASFDPARFLD
ncbi:MULTISPECIES: NYN domain-containing protein [unclassified Pseudactinotalea]|uniref:NYN domain-containing protein n=1 Tax=unclassified Pseudactinotalea TaxID=2649176 RepID=UPI00128BB011|nr:MULTISPECIES: NYN domain-containing protein [unclassified Pseudactinotalea]MPV48555.1 NYN domain-containing protein [Pseudactinotalea sp. HY160]QGH68530.1 NYN domain-containing protein [Pseudactinotalea sp. HY158]